MSCHKPLTKLRRNWWSTTHQENDGRLGCRCGVCLVKMARQKQLWRACAHLLQQLEARNKRAVLDFTPSPHCLHSLGSKHSCTGRRPQRQWRSACAIRVASSAPSRNQGTPGHSKIAQRRRDGWLRPARTAQTRGAQATWRMCQNDDNSALRGPSRL